MACRFGRRVGRQTDRAVPLGSGVEVDIPESIIRAVFHEMRRINLKLESAGGIGKCTLQEERRASRRAGIATIGPRAAQLHEFSLSINRVTQRIAAPSIGRSVRPEDPASVVHYGPCGGLRRRCGAGTFTGGRGYPARPGRPGTRSSRPGRRPPQRPRRRPSASTGSSPPRPRASGRSPRPLHPPGRASRRTRRGR